MSHFYGTLRNGKANPKNLQGNADLEGISAELSTADQQMVMRLTHKEGIDRLYAYVTLPEGGRQVIFSGPLSYATKNTEKGPIS